MSKLLQLRGGTTSQHGSFTGAVRETTVDTTKDTLVVHDGSTAGGFALARESALTTTTATAAAALAKSGGTMSGALNMGANNITTTGKVLFANMYAQTSDLPSASTYHGMFAHVHATGKAYYAHAGAWVELGNQTDVAAALPKSGGTMSGLVNMADQIVQRPVLKDYAETKVAMGSATAVNLENGNVFSKTISGTTTLTFTNPSSAAATSFSLILTNGGSATLNFPSAVDWSAATAPTLTQAGIDILTFTSIDGGTIWYGIVAGQAMG